jgi:N,N'-diacetyllegionaminate synthase
MPSIKIGNKYIGDSYPCFTIAEAGANHDGSLDKALKLIDSAVSANTDSIKFQTYKADKLCIKNSPKYWEDNNPDETQYEVFQKLDSLQSDDWKQIFEYAKNKNMLCFSTPFDDDSADMLYSFNVPAFKIASADITDLPLIKHVAKKQLPIFISTGMASDDEIDDAINTIKDTGNNNIVILHCMTSYPTEPKDANLEMIRTLATKYSDYVIGYSDHTIGTFIPTLSVLYGSSVIEKHFTFDNTLTDSPDHTLSLNTVAFRNMVENLRLAEISKGSAHRENFDCELKSVKYARRSIVTSIKIPKDTIITEKMLSIKRPATGIYPKFLSQIIGSKTIIDVDEDTPLQWTDIFTDTQSKKY